MADEGAETPTVLPKIDFYFVLQTAASDNRKYFFILYKQKNQ